MWACTLSVGYVPHHYRHGRGVIRYDLRPSEDPVDNSSIEWAYGHVRPAAMSQAGGVVIMKGQEYHQYVAACAAGGFQFEACTIGSLAVFRFTRRWTPRESIAAIDP